MNLRNKLFWINIFYLLICLHAGVVIYSASTYLTNIFGSDNIWPAYVGGALLSILVLSGTPRFLKKYRITVVTKLALVLAFLNLIITPYHTNQTNILLSFIAYITLGSLLALLTSIMVEHYSKDAITGGIRGKMLSVENLGYMTAPFFASIFIRNFDISAIFTLSSFFIFLAFIFFYFTIDEFPKISIENKNFRQSARKVWRDADLRKIFIAQFGLYVFYASAVLYIPFKLSTLNIPLTQYLGLILPIALLPFIFVPPLLGHFEDNLHDEREVLIFSYLGLIIILIVFAYLNTFNLLAWIMVLFMSRVFASSAETSINSYLFKKIDSTDTGVIAIFASIQHLVYLIFTPIFGLIFMKYFDLNMLYLFVSLLLTFMLIFVASLRKNYLYEKTHREAIIKNKARERSIVSS